MDIKETVDRLVFAETGKHLSDIQKKAIEGICQDQTYGDIGKNHGYNEKYVADIAAKLYKIISTQLRLHEKSVNKSTFISTIEAARMGYIGSQVVKANDVNGIGINNNFNLYSNTSKSEHNNDTSEAEINPLSNYQDLSIAPRITKFYDRASDLATLSEWIFTQNIPLIAVLGLTGIGKTTLVKRFIDLNSQQFEVIIWRSLKLGASHICKNTSSGSFLLAPSFCLFPSASCLLPPASKLQFLAEGCKGEMLPSNFLNH